MSRFRTEQRGLTLQDATGVWAQFVDGELVTDDERVLTRLRLAPGITEVADEG